VLSRIKLMVMCTISNPCSCPSILWAERFNPDPHSHCPISFGKGQDQKCPSYKWLIVRKYFTEIHQNQGAPYDCVKEQPGYNTITTKSSRGEILSGSRGKSEVFLILLRPQKSITTRSNPAPKPPCGGAPYLHKITNYADSLEWRNNHVHSDQVANQEPDLDHQGFDKLTQPFHQ